VIFILKELVEPSLGESLLDEFSCFSSVLTQSGSSSESRLLERSKTSNFRNRQIDLGIVPVIELENITAYFKFGARKLGTKPSTEFLDMSNASIVLGNLGIIPVSRFECIESVITDMNPRVSGNSPVSWFKEMSKDVALEKVVQNQCGILSTSPVFEIRRYLMLF
jgi:hypothetical protein